MTVAFWARTTELAHKTLMRTWGNPEQQVAAREQDVRQFRYQRLWDYYQGSAFEDMSAWSTYRSEFGLYRQIRQVWDHVHALVEFYATHVWSGTLAEDGLHLPDGVPNAIPLAEDTDETLAAALGQLWTWWNFQEVMTMIVRYTAAVGELLVEIHDDPDTGKIEIDLIWPSFIRDITLDKAGNVKSYCIEYQVYDPTKRDYYIYRREVDADSFRTYRNDEPFDYTNVPESAIVAGATTTYAELDEFDDRDGGGGASITPNPYGFVPAVFFRHIRVIGNHGEPAIWSTQSELDELNGLFSHIIDKTHVSLNAPVIVSGNIAPNALQRAITNMVGSVKRTFTEDLDDPYADRESLNILEGPAGTTVSTIELKVSDAAQILDRIVSAIERKVPEVTFYEQLRAMTQLTGPAASRLLGDVEHKVRSISAGYDRSLTKLMQMSVAIGGWRVQSGDWNFSAEQATALTVGQQKFKPFNLESYAKGDLDFNIMPRDLLPQTVRERYEVLQLKKAVLDILPQTQLAKEGGYDLADAEKWQAEHEAEQLAKQEQALEQAQAVASFKRPEGAPPGGPQKGQANQQRRDLRAVK